jgi:hypothetical protein
MVGSRESQGLGVDFVVVVTIHFLYCVPRRDCRRIGTRDMIRVQEDAVLGLPFSLYRNFVEFYRHIMDVPGTL